MKEHYTCTAEKEAEIKHCLLPPPPPHSLVYVRMFTFLEFCAE